MNDAILIFAGPSLPAAHRPTDARLSWHPPAAAGDLLRLAADPPAAICLIDGYFDQRPAPWHKEILLLLSQGVAVLGAASIGALRAAELDRFGMIGVGAIYRAYKEGRITGDDEVALVHGPEALDWAPLSVPMIELRATLLAGCRRRLIAPEAARGVRDAGRDIHFADRSWTRIEALHPGLEALHVPLKRLDALGCIAAALRVLTSPALIEPPPWTHFMAALAREVIPPGEAPFPHPPISGRPAPPAPDGGS